MPYGNAPRAARRAKRQGKSVSTQAGEFVHREIKRIRKGVHGARSTKQAIAIGLAEARRAGVDLRPPKKGTVSEKTRENAIRAYRRGQRHEPIAKAQSRGMLRHLKHEPTTTVSTKALSRQAHAAAMKRTAADRSASARKAARTRSTRAAKKTARTRRR